MPGASAETGRRVARIGNGRRPEVSERPAFVSPATIPRLGSPDPNRWNEYVLCAYTGHRTEAIFLTGIPDIRESLPHASTDR